MFCLFLFRKKKKNALVPQECIKESNLKPPPKVQELKK